MRKVLIYNSKIMENCELVRLDSNSFYVYNTIGHIKSFNFN